MMEDIDFENFDFETTLELLRSKQYVELCDFVFESMKDQISSPSHRIDVLIELFGIIKPLLRGRVAVPDYWKVYCPWKEHHHRESYNAVAKRVENLEKEVSKLNEQLRDHFKSWLHSIEVPSAMVDKIMEERRRGFTDHYKNLLAGKKDEVIYIGQYKTKSSWSSPTIMNFFTGTNDNELFRKFNAGTTVRITKIDYTGMTHRVVTLPSFDTD
jgi:hypothetical protein